MPTYLDIHDVPGVSEVDAARAHELDLHVQSKHGVNYVRYWVNRKEGKVFCLCTAPSAEAADAVHREAHGMTASRVLEITPEMASAFMGASEITKEGAAINPETGEIDNGTRTVLFTDIVGSTSITQQLGDAGAMALLHEHDRIVRAALAAAHGREVKHLGDGIMAAFHSATSAVRCAMAVQQDIAEYRKANPDHPLRVRIGIAAGEPIEHHKDFFGSTVQLAARLCAHAEPDQILISNAVAELCLGKSLPLKEVGDVMLKGFDQPVCIHCVA